MPFTFSSAKIPDIIKIQTEVFPDNRGLFFEGYKSSEFVHSNITQNFVQDNFSINNKGTIRGLHFQKPPKAQGKLVSVIKGSIWDVVVDIRKSSKTFGQWMAEELSEENHTMLFVPAGFAHGFQALEDDTRVCYKTTDEYAPELESGIRYNDPFLNIPWPISQGVVSEKDLALKEFNISR